MLPLNSTLDVGLTALLGVGSFALLLERGVGPWLDPGFVSRFVRRCFGNGARSGWSWVHVAVVVAVGYATVAAFDLANGLYGCPATGGASDLLGLRGSGLAFWHGRDPFSVSECGTSITVPYGLVAIVLDGLGSLGGSAGIAAVWGAVSVAMVPLVWKLAGSDARYLTLFALGSPLYFPLVAGQIDGASNAIVPLTVFLAIALLDRWPMTAGLLGGLLSSARFPTLFPVLSAAGASPRRFSVGLGAVAAFGVASAIAYLRWGSAFFDAVILAQATRHAYSLNAFGVLLNSGTLPSGGTVTAIQAGLAVLVSLAAFLWVRQPLRSASISLTGVALLTQFLSYPILLWLLPVALVGPRERWWFWGISVVGSLNALLALNVLAWEQGQYGPTNVLDVVMTLLLAGLFVQLWHGARGGRSATGPRPTGAPGPAPGG